MILELARKRFIYHQGEKHQVGTVSYRDTAHSEFYLNLNTRRLACECGVSYDDAVTALNLLFPWSII